jgi:hypothetical protein
MFQPPPLAAGGGGLWHFSPMRIFFEISVDNPGTFS